MADTPLPERFSREMGFTHREFLLNLQAALGDGYTLSDGGRRVEVPVDDGRVLIRLGEQAERRIASLSLPAIEVEFSFENLDEVQRSEFYTAFRRSFQRGGG